jgi:dihydrolipoamide dehydrogenase
MMVRKQEVIDQTCDGVQYLMEKNKIKVYHGMGSFIDKNTILISGERKKEIFGDKIIIATGSKPNYFPGMEPDGNRIITSTEALSLKEVPKHLIVIGGGVIGLELGSVYGRLGSQVTVVEFQDGLLPTMDKTLGKELMKILKKEGFKFLFNHGVQKVNNTKNGVQLDVKNKKGEIISVEGDYCLVAVGRRAYTDKLALENIGLETDKAGRVITNNNLQTSIDNIFAIGDVVKGAMLAHKAEEEGVFVAEFIANQKPHIDYNLVPGVVYTWPEVASVGKTEQELKESNVAFKVGQFPIRALGRARASMDIQGLIKIISDSSTDEVLGVHMIAPRAADLIMEAVVAMEYRASAEDIARICHPHPTYSEAVKEAALAATADRALHI